MSGTPSAPARSAGRIAFVLKGYPRLSETFIAQEIAGLEARSLAIDIVSLRHPTDKATHQVHDAIRAPVRYLPEYLHQEPLRVWKSWRYARTFSGYDRSVRVWRADLLRDISRNRIRRFGQACVLAAELGPDVRHIHAHFLHTPASVARYAAIMLGLPWSVSAHAKDIWTIPDWEKREKLADAAWGVTCTAYGAEHLTRLAPGKVTLSYHGLDFTRFPEPAERSGMRGGPFRILTVGRAVEKKGLDTVLEALARLPADLDWRFVHIGGGKLRRKLKARATRLGIANRTEWRGARPQAEILHALQDADLFVLASRIGRDGDRDGLPNVLMEAQSQRLPVVATAVAAIPELIVDGTSGRLVPPDDPHALADAIRRLAADSATARRLADAGYDRVSTAFDMNAGLDDLYRRFAERTSDRTRTDAAA